MDKSDVFSKVREVLGRVSFKNFEGPVELRQMGEGGVFGPRLLLVGDEALGAEHLEAQKQFLQFLLFLD